jgi:hypothetical protein
MFDMGPVESQVTVQNELRFTSAPWQKILAFSQATGAVREGWELQALHQMCKAYAQSVEEGRNPLCIPPHKRDLES